MDMATKIKEQRLQGIAQLIAHGNLLHKSKILEYQSIALANQQSLLDYLVTNNLIAAPILAKIVAEHFDLPLIDLDCIDFDAIPIELINEQLIRLIRRHNVLPIYIRAQHLFLATDDPSKQAAFQEIQFHTGLPTKAIIAETDKLHRLIDRVLGKENQHLLNSLGNAIELDNIDPINADLTLLINEEDTPIIKFVNQTLLTAIKKSASDIHFEPYEHEYRIRYRQDGLLTEVATPPLNLANRISARIKILANLDIAERRLPQDGRLQMKLSADHVVNFRVSTCPTIHGEKVVIRILDTDLSKLNIDSLGLNTLQKKQFISALKKPQGLILVTGPTGSGKTLTLYTALSLLNNKEKNISTAEDPVEIKIAGINQVNINPKSGLTFSTILRSLLRQDPDIIMVGEIRDSRNCRNSNQSRTNRSSCSLNPTYKQRSGNTHSTKQFGHSFI